MTPDLEQLIDALQQQYRISQEDIDAVKGAIDTTVQETVQAILEENGVVMDENAGIPYEYED